MNPVRCLSRLLSLALLLLAIAGCNCGEEPEELPTPTPTPEPDWNRGYYLDMDMDSQGRAWLAYKDDQDERSALAAARGAGDPVVFSHWVIDGQGAVVDGILQGAFDGGNYASIAVDGNDLPHIAHWDKDGDKLKYAVFDGEAFTTGTIDDGGRFASIGIIGGTTPIVAYQAGSKLKVAVKESAWSDEVVDEGTSPEVPEGEPAIPPEVGQYADLLVASDGVVWIAYYDSANADLKVAHGGPGDWTVETWHSEGDVGPWPNLSEHGGAIWVAFQDKGNHDLLFGHRVADVLEVQVVDDGDFVGADSATAWVGETAAIMYHDGVGNDAKLAVNAGAGWTVATHMADGAVGFFNNLAPTATGDLAWACFDHTSTDIVFSRFPLPAAQ